jgi:serine/threonine-protein kinase RsbT
VIPRGAAQRSTAAGSVKLPARTPEDIVRIRQLLREQAKAIGFSLVDQTKIVTAASELARNTMIYGGGGEVEIQTVAEGMRRGLRLTFVDQGPGIADVELAMKDGFTTGGGLGLGLGGAKRLCNEFSIDSRPGSGTRVTIARWK